MKFIIIAFNDYKDDPGYLARYHAFKNESTRDKINYISRCITQMCIQLKTQKPDAIWIITWHEALLTLSTDTKKYFKSEMTRLTQEFPQLVIIGRVRSQKIFKNSLRKKKLHEIDKAYQQLQRFSEIEQGLFSVSRIKSYASQIPGLINSPLNHVTILRNTCYIFQKDNIFRHDKIAPWYETADKEGNPVPNSFFQPGKERNRNHCFNLIHPLTHESFRIGVEICREHCIGALKNNNEKKPLLHFVISDSVNIDKANISGTYLVHVDSFVSTRPLKIFSTSPAAASQADIKLYFKNLLDYDSMDVVESLHNESAFAYNTRYARKLLD